MKLRAALLGCSVGLLRNMAAVWGLTPGVSTLRTELVEQLTGTLQRAASEGALWRDLGPAERAAVCLVSASGGRHPADLLARRVEARTGASATTGDADAAVASLVERGLLFRVFEGESAPRTTYVLPEEYQSQVAAWCSEGGAEEVLPDAARPDQLRHNDLIVDCFVLASALRREAWNRATGRLVGRRPRSPEQVVGRLPRTLPEPENDHPAARWRFFLDLGRRAGWLRDGELVRPADERFRALLAEPGALLSALWQAYRRPGRLGLPSATAGRQPEPASRLLDDLLLLLAELPVGRWYEASTLASRLAVELGGAGRVSSGESVDARPELASLVESLLRGPLYWLGLVRWGGRADGWALVSTTDSLAFLAGVAPLPVAASGGGAELRPNLELIAHSVRDPATLYEAERYLSLVGRTGERRYRFSAASLARGIRLGGTVADARSLFERLADGELPAAWAQAFEDWAANVGRLKLDALVVLSADEAPTLDRAMAVAGVADALREQLSERVVVVAPELVGSLLRALSDADQPIVFGGGLQLAGDRPADASLLGPPAVELLYLLLATLRRLDAGAAGGLSGSSEIEAGLETVLPEHARDRLERRAEALADRLRSTRERRLPPRAPGEPMV